MMKIPMLILKLPLLLLLAISQAVLSILTKQIGFCTGLLTLVLAGFWIHHCLQGNRENVILLSLSLAVCIGIPVLLQTASALLGRISEIIS